MPLIYDDEDVCPAIPQSERSQIVEEYVAPMWEQPFPTEPRTA